MLELYKLRWNIETDLRHLKQTIHLDRIRSKSVDMVKKEILLGFSAYNLIRAVMALASQQANLAPRDLSFSRVQDIVMANMSSLSGAKNDAEFAEALDRVLRLAAQAKLPKRKGKRSFPRKIWGRGGHFPYRKNTPSPTGEAKA